MPTTKKKCHETGHAFRRNKMKPKKNTRNRRVSMKKLRLDVGFSGSGLRDSTPQTSRTTSKDEQIIIEISADENQPACSPNKQLF